jgi:hypothetical protein
VVLTSLGCLIDNPPATAGGTDLIGLLD